MRERKTRQEGWKEVRLILMYEQGTLQPVFGATTGSMKAGQFAEVLQALEPHQEPPSVYDEHAPVRAAYRYIRNCPDQFDYPSALQAGLPIGSDEIESAHRLIIQQRLKIAGAWWKVDNAEKILALRTTRANGDWENYWGTVKAA